MKIRLIAALPLLAAATLAQAGNVAAPILLPGPSTVIVSPTLTNIILDTGSLNNGNPVPTSADLKGKSGT